MMCSRSALDHSPSRIGLPALQAHEFQRLRIVAASVL